MSDSNSPLNVTQTERIRQEGLARIMWGDSPETVSGWLREQGFPHSQIDEVVQEGLRERAKTVRAAGVDDVITGFVAILVFGGIFLVAFFTRAHFAPVDFTAITGAAYGLYRVLRGVYRMMTGGSFRGSITELSQDD